MANFSSMSRWNFLYNAGASAAGSIVIPSRNQQQQPSADWKSGANTTKSVFTDSKDLCMEINWKDYIF